MNSWIDFVLKARRSRKLLRRAAYSFGKALLRKGWNRWVWMADELRVHRSLLIRSIQKMRMVIAHRAFSGWLDATLNLRRLRACARRSAASFVHRHQALAYRAWAMVVYDRYRIANAERLLLHMRKRPLAMALESWKAMMWERWTIRRAVLRLRHIRLAAAFAGWAAVMAEISRLRGVYHTAHDRMGARKLWSAHSSWITLMKMRMKLRVKYSLRTRLTRRTLFDFFSH